MKGSGGGHVSIFESKCGVRLNYIAMDSTGVQMFSYQAKNKGLVVNTQKGIDSNL